MYVCTHTNTHTHTAVVIVVVINVSVLVFRCLFLTLDPNTANTQLSLSEENRKVTNVFESQSYHDHPDRFDGVHQVLCRESVCGRCYWEIEWSGEYVYISVSYKTISRKGEGKECVFGNNDQSWSLYCSPSSLLLLSQWQTTHSDTIR